MNYEDGAAALSPAELDRQRRRETDVKNRPVREAAPIEEKAQNVAQDLGQVSSMGDAGALIGGLMELAAPVPGAAADAKIKVQVFVGPAYVEQELRLGFERTEHGFEVSGSEAIAVGLGVSAGSLKAWAGVKGSLGFTAKGDSAAECVDMLMLPIYTWMKSQTLTLYDVLFSPQFAVIKALGGMEWLADTVFGDGFDERVLAQMDPDAAGDDADTLTFDGGVGFDAGVEAGNRVGNIGQKAGVEFGMGYGAKLKYGKDDSGELVSTLEHGIKVNFEASLASGGLGGKFSATCWKPSKGPLEAEIGASVELPAGAPALAMASQIIEMWQTYVNIFGDNLKQKGADKNTLSSLQKNAIISPRSGLMNALQMSQIASPELAISLSMTGAQCEFKVEEVKTIAADVNAGIGIAGGSAEVSVGTKLLLHHSSWSKDAAPEGP